MSAPFGLQHLSITAQSNAECQAIQHKLLRDASSGRPVPPASQPNGSQVDRGVSHFVKAPLRTSPTTSYIYKTTTFLLL